MSFEPVVKSVVLGGRDAILLGLVFGGCGNDAIDTTLRGTGVLERSIGTGNDGVDGRPLGCGMMDSPPLFFFWGDCGSSDTLRRLDTDDRECRVGIVGRAEFGGCEALKEARGGRGNAVVVMVMILWTIYAVLKNVSIHFLWGFTGMKGRGGCS